MDPTPSQLAGSELAGLRQENETLKRQLAHLQRLTALGELVGTTTHEFNNALTTIINYAKLGLRNLDEPSRNKAFDRILSAGTKAAKITSGVLSLARNRSANQEPTDLRKLIEDVLLLLERELTRFRVKLDLNLASVPPVMAIGNEIQQLLINLLVNARQAMPDGGKLTLQLHASSDQLSVEIVVRDTGLGIPADKLPRIFDPFYSTKSGPDATGKGGTGLGLAMCRQIVESHRGHLRVESSVGEGTQFTIRLPVAQLPDDPPTKESKEVSVRKVDTNQTPTPAPSRPFALARGLGSAAQNCSISDGGRRQDVASTLRNSSLPQPPFAGLRTGSDSQRKTLRRVVRQKGLDPLTGDVGN